MKMKTKVIAVLLAVFSCCLISAGCVGNTNTAIVIDYSKTDNWLSLPSQLDPVQNVDVFYVYPTEYFAGPTRPPIGEINDAGMVAGAKSAFQKQATAFASVGNIYAPYYRQADAFYTLGLKSIDDVYDFVGGTPATDVIAAFDYYIKKYNNNRPFILASHSQGSTVVALLLQNYMRANPDVYKRMIAAYAIGWSFTPEYFARNTHLKFAQGPDDTGVVISYNTQGPGFKGRNPIVFPGAMAINPITWTTAGGLATVNQSSGSLLLDAAGNVILPPQLQTRFADAQVTRINPITSAIDPSSETSVLICSSADPTKLGTVPGLPEGFYHNYDYPFYYYDIAKNAQNRVSKFARQ
jgi:hypothetical protein